MTDSGPPNVILLREDASAKTACGTFDYSDLNAYLLVVVGLAKPEGEQIEIYGRLLQKAKERHPIPLREVTTLAQKSPLVTLSESNDLSKAIEIFGSGVHRILICQDNTTEPVGILSQLKLVKFLWDNGSSFPTIDQLYPVILRDLNIGTVQTISIK